MLPCWLTQASHPNPCPHLQVGTEPLQGLEGAYARELPSGNKEGGLSVWPSDHFGLLLTLRRGAGGGRKRGGGAGAAGGAGGGG